MGKDNPSEEYMMDVHLLQKVQEEKDLAVLTDRAEVQ